MGRLAHLTKLTGHSKEEHKEMIVRWGSCPICRMRMYDPHGCPNKKMFPFITEVWNPVTGCEHNCLYCWAEKLTEGRLSETPKYQANGFTPTFHDREMKRKFRDSDFVFVCSMGDLFGKWVPVEWIIKIINHIKKYPATRFLLQTKNPGRLHGFVEYIPENCVVGTTIETDIDRGYEEYSKAPLPSVRYDEMSSLDYGRRFVSIEPIMEFNVDGLASWIYSIGTEMVAVGYDNYHNHLPEPSLCKTQELIKRLAKFTDVFVKTIPKK